MHEYDIDRIASCMQLIYVVYCNDVSPDLCLCSPSLDCAFGCGVALVGRYNICICGCMMSADQS